ncbi:MAG: hypothetical protein COA74_16180 [Gammaproteobacteria bacterium]|nr:MAG: hypothetical protein COA74_16180 [Gammaproteobacteria bacterium]
MKTINSLILKSLVLPCVVASCLILIQSPLNAREVTGLFEISVAVDDQNNSTRRRATRQALVEVMIRISGQSIAASNSILKSNLNKSTAYIQRYLYREEDLVDEQGNPFKQLMLDLVFDEMAIRNLLRDANLPRWGANRPQTLIWLAIGDQQQRFLLGTDDESLLKAINQPFVNEDSPVQTNNESSETPVEQASLNLKQIISDKASARGLPILLPLMDLEDSVNIDVADVWGRFISPIRQASERYASDAVAAAQLIREDDQWLTRWLLLHKGRTLSWEHQSDSIESALNVGLDAITDQLAAQYAVYEDSLQRNDILISVNNINRVEDFAALMKYLQGITSIHDVNVAKITQSVIHLKINLIGEQDALIQAISLNNQLIIEMTPSIDHSRIQTRLPALFFHWASDNNNLAKPASQVDSLEVKNRNVNSSEVDALN